ncbi:MAG: radical SAM protein [Bacteroidales bacterium]|jgi:radical SAM protein with 4Fe4S-binding SPASM domain|nr:radical SAM protein [Bacteroidales bacterium]MCH3939923.1 radical SAM protein [Bacteroidales bacterium]MCI2135249.1 radical SAM protein [Bacteroidales bacterium]
MDFLEDDGLEKRLVAKAAEAGVPISANFELTPICNLSCEVCFIRTDRKAVEKEGGLRPLEFWLKTAEELRRMGTLFILLTGGEPLLYPQFKQLYEKLRGMGFILTLNTNGTLIDEETADLFEKLKPRRVNVTLYGGSNETYERACHSFNGYDKCMRGLLLLKKHGIDTKMNVSIFKDNEEDYDKMIATAKELEIPAEVNGYMFPDCRPQCCGRNVCAHRLSPEKAAKVDMEYMRYKKGDNFDRYIAERKIFLDSFVPKGPQTLSCRAGSTSLWIDWEGTMSPCVSMAKPTKSLLESGVKGAWEYIRSEAKKLPPHEECDGCRLHSICNVCYEAATEEKKVNGSLDYLCRMAEAKKKYVNEYAAEHWPGGAED